MRKVVPITKGGQISLPAEIRHRWDATKVVIQDEGDCVVIRPQPKDLIESLIGRFKLPEGMTVDDITHRWRREEVEAENRKWRDYYGDDRASRPLPE